jgi:hypothetical protein
VKKLLKESNIPYIAVIILLIIVILQGFKGCDRNSTGGTVIKTDTVVVYKIVRDTIPGEIVYLKGNIDTVWLSDENYVPRPTYNELLDQYKNLGNSHFKTNVFNTEFKIKDYGSVTVTDSIKGNWLINSTLHTDLKIPITTITKEVRLPPRRQLYIGTTLTFSKTSPVSGVYTGLILKDRQDQLYGLSVGYTGEINLGASFYYKIKLKK